MKFFFIELKIIPFYCNMLWCSKNTTVIHLRLILKNILILIICKK